MKKGMIVLLGLILMFSFVILLSEIVYASSCGSWSGPNRDCERPDSQWCFIDWRGSPGHTRAQCENICEGAGATCAQWESTTGRCACSDNNPRDTPGTFSIWSTYCSGGVSSCTPSAPEPPSPPPCSPSCSSKSSCCGSKVCGTASDGCGTSYDCGSCSSGYSCSGGSCILNIECGNSVVQTGEECDDGNTDNGDGCDSLCQIEENWNCTGEPSACVYNCQFTSSNWSVSETTDGNLVNLNVIGNEFCDGKAVSFEVFENELIGRDAVSVNPSNVIFSGTTATATWVAEWIDDGFGQGNPEYVFTASLVDSPSIEIDDSGELIVLPGDGSVDCDNVTSCSNYLTSGSCVSDSCGVVDGSVESNNPLVDCGAGDTSCECAWVSNNCEPSYTNVAGDYVVGTCSYSESTSDDCEDGILSYSWSASWTWGHDGWLDWNDGPSVNVADYKLDNGKYYYDPDGKFDGCVDGNTIVKCPASIEVGFFGVWNFIIAIIILVGIYFFIEIKKK